MLIDFHLHVGTLYVGEKGPLSPNYLLKFMDREGIARACLLPMENPEHTDYYVLTEYVLGVARRHPDRFIPFCNVDPRRRSVAALLREYHDRGCAGCGEVIPNLAMDDPLMQRVYETCGELGMPIVFDLMANSSCYDESGLPRFRKMARKFSNTVFVGHGPHFWANIAAGYEAKRDGSYPNGKVRRPGAVVRLLRQFPNAYADISARSGLNALTRDPDFGPRFLEDFQDKLLFGTDLCRRAQQIPHARYLAGMLRERRISRGAFEKIGCRNALRLLKV